MVNFISGQSGQEEVALMQTYIVKPGPMVTFLLFRPNQKKRYAMCAQKAAETTYQPTTVSKWISLAIKVAIVLAVAVY